ncbi:hypothetical protein QC761_0070520 [Podospora bellae-mahoneyi]|uniref:Uncharacterized protein n=1 Tax=Podospora bellae-mahoneyi TaxID=2093777 RepID=A0ABR0FI98_9PEZI|nr:hypothetical protein QC761_0070520 [Podospora bellae-mahoneyi]
MQPDTLSSTEKTLFVTLKARQLLGDSLAAAVVEQIDYDFDRLQVGSLVAGVIGLRSALFDKWIRDFLTRHSHANVIHLACGLDTRPHRISWGDSVRWIDVDLPDVVDLRRESMPEPSRANQYSLMAGSALDPAFIQSLQNDRPTIIVIEGLVPYLTTSEGEAMIANLCGHFKTGELIFDITNWYTTLIERLVGSIKHTKAKLRWTSDKPKNLERVHPGLTLLKAHPLCTLDGVRNLPLGGRIFLWLQSLIPFTRYSAQYLRLAF